ncbi:MAG: cyclic nucleotide-binding domain-containing protein [Dehalococcoidia bacterium]|nr:cyclic nucleotide-binding domain-containing protein [Dehalococcoidia bacterium]
MTVKTTLKACDVFSELSDSDLDQVAGFCAIQDFGAGTTIFAEGTPSDNLYVLESGKVVLQMQLPAPKPQSSRRVSVDVVTKNEVFGWSALVEPRRYTLTAVCLEPCKVLAIDGARLRVLFNRNKAIGYDLLTRMMAVVASRLEETRHVLISERTAANQG